MGEGQTSYLKVVGSNPTQRYSFKSFGLEAICEVSM